MEQLRFLSWAALKIILNLQGRGEKGIGLNGDRDMPQTTQLKITWKMGMGNANRKKKKKKLPANPRHKIPKENQTGPIPYTDCRAEKQLPAEI